MHAEDQVAGTNYVDILQLFAFLHTQAARESNPTGIGMCWLAVAVCEDQKRANC